MHSFRYRNGRLFCEGVSVGALAEKYGTPLYVYSRAPSPVISPVWMPPSARWTTASASP